MPSRFLGGGALSASLLLPALTALLAVAGNAAESETVLLGSLTREEIEAALPSWVEEQIASRPDPEAAARLGAALTGAEVEVFLGTWCSDSRRELGRLWRALDEAGLFEPDELSYVGVDRSREEPAGLAGEREILFVPTFFVSRDGAELGRIVETSPDGIERDLLALLEGRKRGLVTARDDLAVPDEAAEPEDRR